MKSMTLIILLSLTVCGLHAQGNMLTDGGFENQTIYAGSQIARITTFGDLGSDCQTDNPKVDPAVKVESGVWYRKSPNSGYVKATITRSDKYEGECALMLATLPNSSQVNLDNWYNNTLTQFVKVDRKKEYTITLFAKNNVDCSKIYIGMVSGKGGSVKGSNWVNITGEWAEYKLTVYPSAHPDKGQFTSEAMDMTAVIIGLPAVYRNDGKTQESSVLIDNISIKEEK